MHNVAICTNIAHDTTRINRGESNKPTLLESCNFHNWMNSGVS